MVELKRAHGWDRLDITCLPAIWHNPPHKIPEGVRRKIREGRRPMSASSSPMAIAAPGAMLDRVLAEEGVERIEGPHCYQFYAGTAISRR